MEESTKRKAISVNDRLPPVNERVIVVCKGSRCLGFLDREKTWRDANRLTELADVIAWYRMGTDFEKPDSTNRTPPRHTE